MKHAAVLCFLALACPAMAGEVHLDVVGSLRGIAADGAPSWLGSDWWGKMELGGDENFDTEFDLFADAQLGVDWRPTDQFGLVASGVVRREPSDYDEGEAIGLVEAYAEGILFFREADRLRLRGGMFFLPTSRENTGPMWSSPYTISFSAINSWIGEEVRPIGLDADYRFEGPVRVSLGATGFVGNDTMGTLLTWRGWSMGKRLSVYDEVLPLPHLWSLDQTFRMQKDGTTAITSDLDDSLGWSARVRLDRPDVFTAQVTHVDNRGDGLRYGDEYAWDTAFTQLGFDLSPGPGFIAGEYLRGETYMGNWMVGTVNARFESAYLLGSWDGGRWRASLRRDWMRVDDLDQDVRAENNDEEGWAWTGAFFWSLTDTLRLGFEIVDIDADNESSWESDYDRDVGGTSATVELRWTWGRTY